MVIPARLPRRRGRDPAVVILRRTAFGLFVEAVGANAPAAPKVGVGTRAVIAAAYAICGVTAALAGIVVTGDVRASDAVTAGMWSELDAILAVVLGGACSTAVASSSAPRCTACSSSSR